LEEGCSESPQGGDHNGLGEEKKTFVAVCKGIGGRQILRARREDEQRTENPGGTLESGPPDYFAFIGQGSGKKKSCETAFG